VIDFATTDLCDAHEAALASGELQVMAPGLRSFGQRTRFAGEARTLALFEDNLELAELVRSPGRGHVLVVDGGASLRCAVLGGNLAKAAAINGWAGVVISGAVRDVGEIAACDVGVLALATNPRRPAKRGGARPDLPVMVQGARVVPGMWVYADADGVVVAARALHAG
jgi:regulator of ribonuclease activity A